MSASIIEGLKPQQLWHHFESLTQIPRCSGNEEQVARFVLDWAQGRGFSSYQDKQGNVVVRVPATAGLEQAPTVVLQGHLDMVGEKDASSPHDFAKDPIQLQIDGEYLTAQGTTLGADNGVGVAAAMAVAEDQDSRHGPLELLCTVDEETGLTGAKELEGTMLQGRLMLNLDSEEEGELYVGCAGGADTVIELPLQREKGTGEAHQLKALGFKGGHSGLDINTGRGNPIQVLAWCLDQLRDKTPYQLVSFKGGDKRNAIAREAVATLLLPPGSKSVLTEHLASFHQELLQLFSKTDPEVKLELNPGAAEHDPLTAASRDHLIDLLRALPHGVLQMSQDVAGLVETSTNLGVVGMEEGKATIQETSRSLVMPAITVAQSSIFAAARLAGATPIARGGYPGWQPKMDSVVLKRAREAFEETYGYAPAVKAIHAGLECGIIGEKFSGMEMISFGPQIENPHSPSERVQISSVDKFYTALKVLLERLTR